LEKTPLFGKFGDYMNTKTNSIYREIEEFKDKVYLNHKVKLYVFFKENDELKLTLNELEYLVLFQLKSTNPEYRNLYQFRKTKWRKQALVLHRQIFSYIACCEYGYGKSEIGRFIGNDHTNVIHAIKTITNYFDINDRYVTTLYSSIKKLIENYVGDATKNPRIPNIT